MTAFAWIIAIVLSAFATVSLIASSISALRSKRAPAILASAVFIAGFAAAVLLARNPYWTALAAVASGLAARVLLRRTSRNSEHAAETWKLSAAHSALIAGSVLFLIPFVWLISSSLKTDDEQASFPPVWIPTQQITSDTVKNAEGEPAGLSWWTRNGKRIKVLEVAELPSGEVQVRPVDQPQTMEMLVATRDDLTKIRHVSPRWKNYSEALAYLPPETNYGLVFLGNTLFLTLMTVIGTVLSSSMVAYAFARLRWPGKKALFVVLLATMMIPGAVTMMPQFLIFRSLGWIDTLKPLWVPAFFGSAFNIFLLRQFFMSIPTELEDAAKIDGCGAFGIYWRIMLPMVKPALAAISIMTVLGAWNNFQGPLIYLSSPQKMPLAYALQLYQQQHGGEPGLLMAASTLMVLPIIILFFFTQRYFIEGVSLTGFGGR
ncbi:MAG: multiple sugar transport system permease protein [Abditibacteriota bacterium]|nr:multiple sugar transport system permease protein [Abditibacteriota bacterium]